MLVDLVSANRLLGLPPPEVTGPAVLSSACETLKPDFSWNRLECAVKCRF